MRNKIIARERNENDLNRVDSTAGKMQHKMEHMYESAFKRHVDMSKILGLFLDICLTKPKAHHVLLEKCIRAAGKARPKRSWIPKDLKLRSVTTLLML